MNYTDWRIKQMEKDYKAIIRWQCVHALVKITWIAVALVVAFKTMKGGGAYFFVSLGALTFYYASKLDRYLASKASMDNLYDKEPPTKEEP